MQTLSQEMPSPRASSNYLLSIIGLIIFPVSIFVIIRALRSSRKPGQVYSTHARWQARTAIVYWVAAVVFAMLSMLVFRYLATTTEWQLQKLVFYFVSFSQLFWIIPAWGLFRLLNGWRMASAGLEIANPRTLWLRPKAVPTRLHPK